MSVISDVSERSLRERLAEALEQSSGLDTEDKVDLLLDAMRLCSSVAALKGAEVAHACGFRFCGVDNAAEVWTAMVECER